ncbi:hypothetical protein CASFOL_000962 [Castilleja foliolosa]|uniref:Flavin-containing monooxygenase n=1 Tax=Castilleja foliolosa TaxID=1961234 RepID=A0ABD3ELR0_9LAMI
MVSSKSSCEPNRENYQVAIIGAGLSGILACKHTIESGFNPIIFEARNNLGGVWSSTIDSTKLQTPKDYFQFSDFSWPENVSETFPNHNHVLEYITSYAHRFDVASRIKFNSKVISVDYVSSSDNNMRSWDLWGGNGEAFSNTGKWNVVVQNVSHPIEPRKVYEVDFVIMCIGKFSDLPNIPDFPISQGANVFNGDIMHSMDYAKMDKIEAAEYTKNKRVTVVGFQKSALDIASEIAKNNGTRLVSLHDLQST